MQNLNLYLFHLLNVPEHASSIMQAFAIFTARDLISIVCILFILAWFFSPQSNKENIVKGFIFATICLFISGLISWIFPTPRPFVMGVGHTILAHVPTASFPSNHMAILCGLAFSYYFSTQRKLSYLLFAIAWLVAWSRIYVGVHFPLDMFGSFFLALSINWIGLPLWLKYKDKMMFYILKMHYTMFRFLINKGYIS